jgi:hypothetical protein
MRRESEPRTEVAQGSSQEELSMPRDRGTEEPDAAKVASPVLKRRRGERSPRRPRQYALHDAVKALRCSWIAEHLDAVLAQALATRAYRALNRVCLGQARRVRGV